ncbi:hypothetical protein FRC09_016154 [Ceratobasidium sp. 395]|nr:hypothetical protein FRC09_016154 [Ceratobasidium sp. 395]
MVNSSTNKLGVVHRVLGLPELIRLICEFLEKDAARLVCLSRSLFAGAAPVVWADVELRHLLGLVPETKQARLGETEDNDWYVHYVSMFDFITPVSHQPIEYQRLEMPAQINLERFDCYAPFVKQLSTSYPYAIKLPPQWEQSLLEVTAPPLLPNLSHLTITHTTPIRRENIEWATLFIGLSLLSFESHYRFSKSLHETEEEVFTTELVAKMLQVCVRLERLCVHSREDLLVPVSSLIHLRFFSVNECGATDELLHALGRLPSLEKLEIFSEWRSPHDMHKEPVELSDDSFPSLRHLYLYQISPFCIARFCASSKLFRKLVNVSIFFDHSCIVRDMDNLERFTAVVFPLGHNSPHITKLRVQLWGWFTPSWSTIDSFKQMPLRHLDLYSVALGLEDYVVRLTVEDCPVYHPLIGWRDFLAAIPLLEKFRLTDQTLGLSTLPAFASMLPHLRLLDLDKIEFSGAEETPSIDGWHPATQFITIRTSVFKIPVSGKVTISDIARYIHYLWPNAKFECRDKHANEKMSGLNQEIRSLKIGGSSH